MNESSSREQRNINVLKLKNQDIKTKYASGKVRVDIPGTEQEMTSNTILAVPSRLITREGVIPAKSITIKNYTQAGASGKLVSTQTVGLQNNMVDLDEALDFTISTEGGKMGASNNKAVARRPALTSNSEFGVAVNKPVAKTAAVPTTDLVALARTLLGR